MDTIEIYFSAVQNKFILHKQKGIQLCVWYSSVTLFIEFVISWAPGLLILYGRTLQMIVNVSSSILLSSLKFRLLKNLFLECRIYI